LLCGLRLPHPPPKTLLRCLLRTESLFEQTSEAAGRFQAAYIDQQDFLEIVQELQQLSTFTHIKGSGNARGYKLRPCIAVGVELQSGGRGKTAREGTVKFTVGANKVHS
jgi:hypothetical protein